MKKTQNNFEKSSSILRRKLDNLVCKFSEEGCKFLYFGKLFELCRYKHWGQASPWLGGINPLDHEMPIDGDDGFFPTSGNDLKPEIVNSSRKYHVRVLVCAPSNSALDEIVLRILNSGYFSAPFVLLQREISIILKIS
ncbi:probable helicase MAGATAMA 3 [Solanum verrucosum]|uniref:probable helicase MAGATAMA 3 n=1 Tax=Solanum verrucosum TaxID=315347 RepID=UPI0020D1242C|nr:probable helicase MAGATAMA 3 [Solanum verrucosum]